MSGRRIWRKISSLIVKQPVKDQPTPIGELLQQHHRNECGGFLDWLGTYSQDVIWLCERYGFSNVRLIGSVARGEDDPFTSGEADVDFLVEANEAAGVLSWSELSRRLELLLECHVSVIDETALPEDSRDEVLNEAIPLAELLN